MTIDRIAGNGPIRIVGTFGENDVDLRLEGVELRDLFGAAALLGQLSEYRRLETDHQRNALAKDAMKIADSMVRSRKR